MSVRNLDYLFKPESIAIVGASRREGSVGNLVVNNLLRGGFTGRLYPVNPQADTIASLPVYHGISSLPEAPDLAVVCTRADTVPDIIGELGHQGCKAAIVITAGFGELGEEGKALQQRMLDAARPYLMRIVGPNCVGLLAPGSRLNASFAHISAEEGRVAFIAQSGAILTSVLDWAAARDIRFSHLVSLGDMADVDFGDLLDYLGADPKVKAILLYMEGLTHARKFMSAARRAARVKPVVVVKSGRFPEGSRAAASHTGALAGSDAVYDAAFRRAGMLRVFDLPELFAAVETLDAGMRPAGERLAILGNGEAWRSWPRIRSWPKTVRWRAWRRRPWNG